MIFVDVDTEYGTKDYLIDEHAACSEVICDLTQGPDAGYRLSDGMSGAVLREDMSLEEQGITSGCRLRLRRYRL